MAIARFALKILASKAKVFERATEDPLTTQEKILFEYLSRNKNTEYGIHHEFSQIKSTDDYQSHVPIGGCELLCPYMERMAKGESNVLTADKPVFFGLTSGTTSHPKFIPVTKQSQAKKVDVTNLWAYYINKDHPRVLEGKILAVVNTGRKGLTESGIPYGAETGYGYKNLPMVVRALYAIPYYVFDIGDYNSRYYCILRIGIERNITTIAAPTPSTIVLLCQKIEEWKEAILRDIENGTLNENLVIPDGIRKKLEKLFKANPKRAAELKEILKEKGELLPKYFWPNLELIECWKGGTLNLYLKEFPKYFGDISVRDFGYISTEARCSIPMSDIGSGGVLAINTNFYEFIPKEEIGKKEREVLLCNQLEKNGEYFLIVTTSGGLYRYYIDDIIRVTGFFNKTPIIEFVQKGLYSTSLAGEKLYESQVNEAVNEAAGKQNLLIEFFSTTIQWGQPPRYAFLIEFDGEPSMDKKKGLLRSIEEGLYRQNILYEDKRKAHLVAPPVLKVLKRGDFERYRIQKVKNGTPDSQFKTPVLTADLNFQNNFNITEEIKAV